MGKMSLDMEDQSSDEYEGKYWSKRKEILLMQKKKALDEKQSMEDRGIHRYPYQGTCGFCESWAEMVYATIIDLCTKCTDRAVSALGDKKIYFKIVARKLNTDMKWRRCQACNRKDMIVTQVNIKACPKCMRNLGKMDHVKNKPHDQKQHFKRQATGKL